MAREVIINFRIKTRGLYEIIEPVLEEHEVFDSSLLKETLNSLIASGKRNFAFDMSPLDYIYSDTINMLMALNRRVLDVTGRLSLLAPQPEVVQILKRAGIHNILRIFETETELIKSSEDMILQTTSIKLSDVNAAIKQAQPQSEFDQLRSEIGSVFGESAEDPEENHHSSSSMQNISPQGKTVGGHEDEFDQMFQQFGQGQAQAKTDWGAPPIQPQPSKFQPQQYTPSSRPQSMPMRPSTPSMPGRPSTETPKFSQDFTSARSETQRFSSAPAKSFDDSDISDKKPLSFDEDFLDSSKKPVRKGKFRDDFDSLDDDLHHDEFKKKSPLPIIVVVLLVAIFGGIGAYIANLTLQKKETTSKSTTVTTPSPATTNVAPPPPQLPVDSQNQTPPPPPPSASEESTPVQKEIVQSKPEVSAPPVRRSVPRREPRRSSPPAVSRAPQVQKESETKNQIQFTSAPSGATILINGQKVGTTPFTWTKPFFGTVNVQIVKSGYETAKKSFEFTGGSVNEFYSLEQEVAQTPPPPVVKEVPKPLVREEPPVVTTPRKVPPPPPSAEEEDPFKDIGEDDDFALEPEEPSAPAAVSTPKTQAPPSRSSTSSPVTSTPPSRGSIGGEAQIFIASIPPVADVYMGDQLVGKTNVSELKLPAGTHSLRFVKGGKEITKEITLKPGKNPSQMVRIP